MLWQFWETMLTTVTIKSFIGYAIILSAITISWRIYNRIHALFLTLLILLLVGPVILYTPMVLIFMTYNMLTGHWLTPIGCIGPICM